MREPGRLPGLLFLIALLALTALAVTDLSLLARSQRTGYDYGGVYANEERAVLARSVVMTPGDRLQLTPGLAGGWPTVMRYDFYVVNGGDRFVLLDGEAPRVVYHHIANISAQGCCPDPRIVWDRPDDAFAHRAGSPQPETGPGIAVDMRALETGATDQPDRIDLVWVLTYGPNVTVPAEGLERRTFESRLETSLGGHLGGMAAFNPAMPTVHQAAALRWHPLLTGAMAACALIAAGAAILWTGRLRRARVEPEGPGAASMLQLYEAGGAHLATLRDLLLGSLVVVLGVAFHVFVSGEPGPVLSLARLGHIGDGPRVALAFSLTLLYAAVVVVWAWSVWRVHAALRRWRRHARPDIL